MLDKPELYIGLNLYYDAFAELNEIGRSEEGKRISISTMVEYCRIFDIGEVDEFVYLVSRLDKFYLQHLRVKK